MAPAQPLSVIFDYRGQIVENCEFITIKDDYLSIITPREASGQYKAIVVRTNGDAREAFIASEPCDSVQRAIESLHTKSSEALDLYIKANGYSVPRDLKREEDDSDDETLSVVSGQSAASSARLSIWDSSDEEAVTPASSSSRDKRTRKSRRATKVRQPRKCKANDTDEELLINTIPIRPSVGPHVPPPPPGWQNGPPPPPPVYRGGAPGMPGPPPMHLQVAPPGLGVPGGAGPQLPSANTPPQLGMRPMGPGANPRLYDVRITIRWLHHSEQRVFESSRASIRALQDTTLAYVRAHMIAFENVTPLDHAPNKMWTLRASVRQAFFGNEAYDMSGYRGDDLTKLFNVTGKNDIPRFEIDVDYVRPPMPGGFNPMNASPLSS
ncbi:hypothetical protein BJ170DRAFT_682208 [Xylariales sp. AK1849]|nr:hypothetical protein BJ170DRAFT_682208 [Xylariales sp. AK1849]